VVEGLPRLIPQPVVVAMPHLEPKSLPTQKLHQEGRLLTLLLLQIRALQRPQQIHLHQLRIQVDLVLVWVNRRLSLQVLLVEQLLELHPRLQELQQLM